MAAEADELTGVRETLLYTLYFRALDQRSRSPIVGDEWADRVVDQVAPRNRKGLRTAKLGASGRFPPLLRARRLDDWTREFLDQHLDASVLQLGCGLDSRAFRLNVPESVGWYDLDFADVIDVRRPLYPSRDGYHLIAAAATDPGWLEEIPADRPLLMIAEGVLPYLTEAEVQQLFARITDRFPSGELIFDGVAGATFRMTKLFQWRLGDPGDIAAQNPRLTLTDVVPVLDDCDRIPNRGYRTLFRLLKGLPSMRITMRMLRFRF